MMDEERREALQWDLEKMEFLARLLGAKWRAPKLDAAGAAGRREIGEYCGGRDLEHCRGAFGERLAEICATCPE